MSRAQKVKLTWADVAHLAIVMVSSQYKTFTTDDVWEAMGDTAGLIAEPRAMGGAMQHAARTGTIKALAQYQPSTRKACHSRPVRVWTAA